MSGHDPIAEFRRLFGQAERADAGDATACCLATADADGRPSARMVLLKRVEGSDFQFCTNYGSRKARELEENPRAALCFYWSWIDRQVRVEGSVQRLDPATSDEHYGNRPRGSRIAAWASKQSQPLASRGDLLGRVVSYEARFAGRDVPRPEFWGCYRLTADRIEIWHDKLYRLHDRVAYQATADGWERQRLYP